MNAVPSAPRSLAQLRSLVADIRAGGGGPRIGERALAALEGIVATPQIAAISSISELALANGVNASTLTRLAQRLGYSGFNAFQDVFRQHLSNGNDVPASAPAGARERHDPTRIAIEEIDNIRATLDAVGSGDLARLGERVMRAQRVRVAGANATHGLAGLLVHGLSLLRDGVAQLSSQGQGLSHALAHLDANDLIIVLSIAPHARATLELARAAARLRLAHIVLCDAPDAKLTARAAQILVCRGGGSAFPAATASMTLVIEVLLVAVLRGLDENGRRELLRRQRLVAELESVPHPAPIGSRPRASVKTSKTSKTSKSSRTPKSPHDASTRSRRSSIAV